MNFEHDIVIIGAGLAGLRAAVECADETNVAVVSKFFPPGLTQVQHKRHHSRPRERGRGPWECTSSIRSREVTISVIRMQ